MNPTTGLLGIVSSLFAWSAVLAGETASLPRYRFEPGLELAFRASSVFKFGEGKSAGEHDYQNDWNVWVLRANKDGSFHLVLREKDVFSQTIEGKKLGTPAETHVVYADVFPDGRVLPSTNILYHGHPAAIFPQLPRDAAEATKGWESVRGDDKTTFIPLKSAQRFVFEAASHSLFDKIYLSSSKSKMTFDPAKGFVVWTESENTQGYGFSGKGSGTTELLSIKTVPPGAMRPFADAADQYFAAVDRYDASTAAAGKAPPEAAKALLVKAVAGLKTAAAGLKQEEFKTDLAEKIKRHEATEKYLLEEAERRAKVVGQPAADFETTDIDGKKVKLADLRDKVVVLDFWYRGCGWCIKAMPQMNQLAEEFAGKPVAIFGMNTDRNEADAKFVIEKMELKYPTLKAVGQPEKFGVQGFPTLIVIDPRGRVHDIHVGYSPTLREDVGKQIRQLLAGK
jgi:peroxiredoxin